MHLEIMSIDIQLYGVQKKTVNVCSNLLKLQKIKNTFLIHLVVHTDSEKVALCRWHLCQILINIQNSFTVGHSSKSTLKQLSLEIPLHLKHVATLPCEILQYNTTDKVVCATSYRRTYYESGK